MYIITASYIKGNEVVSYRQHDEYIFSSLHEAQLEIENIWELDLEIADIWYEELSPEERDELAPKEINKTIFVCEKIPGFDRVVYQIVEE